MFDVRNLYDYYPFGMTVPNRNYSSPSYRYGFNGMEKDDDVKGNNNSYDFGARMYDPRVGRWFRPDPFEKEYPQIAPYTFALSNPILLIDMDGNVIFDPKTGKPITLKFSDKGELLAITGTDNSRLKELLIDTYNSSDLGKEAILRLNSKDVKAEIKIQSKRTIWVGDKDAGEIGGISQGIKARGGKFKEIYKIEILAYDVEGIGGLVTDDNISDFVFENPDGEIIKLTEERKQTVIEQTNSHKRQKNNKEHNKSNAMLTPGELKKYNEITNKDKKNRKSRNINTLIFETNNADRQADFPLYKNKKGKIEGEYKAKKAVIKANSTDEQ